MPSRKTALVLATTALIAVAACEAQNKPVADEPADVVNVEPSEPETTEPTTRSTQNDPTPTTAPSADSTVDPAPTGTPATEPVIDEAALDEMLADIDSLLGDLSESFNQSEGDMQP